MHASLLTPTSIIASVKAQQKAAWESGNFGKVALYNEPTAEEFMSRLPITSSMTVLDAACGTGNLAVIAAQLGCKTSGIDFASNLIAQARHRANHLGLNISFMEGDVEELPYAANSFDAVVSMFGVMFAPQPRKVVQELLRVTRPGGVIALACWTPEGFIGHMFSIFRRHLPPAPLPTSSPLEWGNESVVRERLFQGIGLLRTTRHTTHLRYPFSPAETVDFFREYYGPTRKAFEALDAAGRKALHVDLVRLQEEHNISGNPDVTDTPAEYLEIVARRI
ncbi:class I SAM-dependent methyltransferase [Roseimicrobium sp. ORNL1]|uniref:class I SAM-dependent methyltransferase n=1 Tax=Roseimicrobium sp. ORNL1 TaxID=2711231 RepID=UPI0013E1A92E|nr:class I SAM-dependent methyltransferase [Roseimicrobium sp. ORNL1]QIF04969.1 class I SAM-dependent methyltransferase [Roseimicrobium sp. ORNL1]